MKKRFSIRYKLILIFGFLIVTALTIESVLAVHTARKAVIENIEAHLLDKVHDTTEILDGRIEQWFQLLEGIAQMPALRSTELSYFEKAVLLKELADKNTSFQILNIITQNGINYSANGRTTDISSAAWFKAYRGKPLMCEPFVSLINGKMVIIIAVPIYDDNNQAHNILAATIDGFAMYDAAKDIVIGKTGNCSIVGDTGIVIADQDTELIKNQFNPIEEAESYQNLIYKGLTHDEIAQIMGKSRPYITNLVRLLQLPDFVLKAVKEGHISQAHARLLIKLKEKDQRKWLENIISSDISVRKLEKLLQTSPIKSKSENVQKIFIEEEEENLKKLLGVEVKISLSKKQTGKISISFSNQEEYERIINSLK